MKFNIVDEKKLFEFGFDYEKDVKIIELEEGNPEAKVIQIDNFYKNPDDVSNFFKNQLHNDALYMRAAAPVLRSKTILNTHHFLELYKYIVSRYYDMSIEWIEKSILTTPWVEDNLMSLSENDIEGWSDTVFTSTQQMHEMVEKGDKYVRDVFVNCFSHYKTDEPIIKSIHRDTYSRYATLIYLNKPEHCSGGTAFWKHNIYNSVQRTEIEDRLHLANMWVENDNYNSHQLANHSEQLGYCGNDKYKAPKGYWCTKDNQNLWELKHLSKMKYNRFLFYPATIWHSSYIEKKNKFDDVGRHVQVSFIGPDGKVREKWEDIIKWKQVHDLPISDLEVDGSVYENNFLSLDDAVLSPDGKKI
tara:strand:+ start:5572 stop:6648 length:1077 start_codon:yes stop_codon:yes gene_type:complete